MKRYLFLAIAILGAVIWIQAQRLASLREDRNRLANNQTALFDSVDHYKTAAGKEAASVQMLELEVSELKRHNAAATRTIRDLGIRLRRVESTATVATKSEISIATPLRDSMRNVRLDNLRHAADSVKARINRERAEEITKLSTSPELLKTFTWADPHTQVSGIVTVDSVICNVTSVDTLRQVVHRVPRRFLFIRYGTKAIRQEITSSNPRTRIVYAEYIELKRKQKRK